MSTYLPTAPADETPQENASQATPTMHTVAFPMSQLAMSQLALETRENEGSAQECKFSKDAHACPLNVIAQSSDLCLRLCRDTH